MHVLNRSQRLFETLDVILDQLRPQALLGGKVMVNTGLADADLCRKIGIAER
ncbi:hypothetical protein D3C85_1860100 [compost metagenome]